MDIHHNCIPLTRPQYQIWLASESCPDKALYTESVLLTFDNAPDPGLLNRALNRLVETTETLRIRVTRAKDGPLQYDAGYTPFACRVVPLSGEDELAAVFDEQARFCFDLYDSPLFNAVIYTLPGKTALLRTAMASPLCMTACLHSVQVKSLLILTPSCHAPQRIAPTRRSAQPTAFSGRTISAAPSRAVSRIRCPISPATGLHGHRIPSAAHVPASCALSRHNRM